MRTHGSDVELIVLAPSGLQVCPRYADRLCAVNAPDVRADDRVGTCPPVADTLAAANSDMSPIREHILPLSSALTYMSSAPEHVLVADVVADCHATLKLIYTGSSIALYLPTSQHCYDEA